MWFGHPDTGVELGASVTGPGVECGHDERTRCTCWCVAQRPARFAWRGPNDVRRAGRALASRQSGISDLGKVIDNPLKATVSDGLPVSPKCRRGTSGRYPPVTKATTM